MENNLGVQFWFDQLDILSEYMVYFIEHNERERKLFESLPTDVIIDNSAFESRKVIKNYFGFEPDILDENDKKVIVFRGKLTPYPFSKIKSTHFGLSNLMPLRDSKLLIIKSIKKFQ